MRNAFLFMSIILMNANLFGQNMFEKGYFIDKAGQKTECLIKNMDWENNPYGIIYKKNEESQTERTDTAIINEFCIYEKAKYVLFNVKIDRGSSNIDNINYNRNPEWSQANLFLKVLVEGKATLYSFTAGNLVRYFYSVDGSFPEQLVFREYRVRNVSYGTNSYFRTQLWNSVNSGNSLISDLDKLSYKKEPLVKYFLDYNEYFKSDYKQYKVKRDHIDLKIVAGTNYSTLSVDEIRWNVRDFSFDPQISFTYGIEAEIILPFQNGKWRVVFAPTYNSFKSKTEINSWNPEIDYHVITFPFGIRNYIFLGKESSIFFNGLFSTSVCFNFDSKFKYTDAIIDNAAPQRCFAVGAGFQYSKFSTEIRYYTSCNLLTHSQYIGDFKRISFTLGYKFF